MRKAYLASIVPVIVNAVLNEHQVVVDIVAFVSKGDFPRSRLGEKQRGKILASWVTRKMRTIAQFGIRDADGADSQITEVAEPRSGLGSVIGVGSSLKNVETIVTPPANNIQQKAQDYVTLPTGISEMPANYESSIVESPPLPLTGEDRDSTPPEPRSNNNDFSPTHSADNHDNYTYKSYNPGNGSLPTPRNASVPSPEHYPDYEAYTAHGEPGPTPADPERQSFEFVSDRLPHPARSDSKPALISQNALERAAGDLWSLPSQQQRFPHSQTQNTYQPGINGNKEDGLGHASSSASPDHYDIGDADDWRQDAIMHMNLARDGSQRAAHVGVRSGGLYDDSYDGSGYGHAM